MRCLSRDLPDGKYLAFPVNDDLVRLLAFHRRDLAHRFFYPDCPWDLVYDKYAFCEAAHRAGVPAPTTLLYAQYRRGRHECSGATYVLKGRTGGAFRKATGRKCLFLSRKTEKALTRWNLPGCEVLVQEYVPSETPVVSLCGLAVDGQLDAAFMYEKVSQHPREFGTGTLLRSCHDPQLLPLGRRLLQSLRFTGVFEMEFKWSERHGSYVVLEMNPRTWKSVHFAALCGQNLPARYLATVNGRRPKPDFEYDVGKTWVDLATHVPEALLRGEFSRILPACDYECVWNRDDPMPFFKGVALAPLIMLGV